jgi:putative phosphoribosyl transferase
MLVRKLGVPGHEELALGAIATGGVRVLNDDVVYQLEITPRVIDDVTQRETEELLRRERAYRGDRPLPDLRDRPVILVDDGLATGSTMRAAVTAVRLRSPSEIVVAVPVGAAAVCARLREIAEAVVCPATPDQFHAVGLWYDDFTETTDEVVRDLLNRAADFDALGSGESPVPP